MSTIFANFATQRGSHWSDIVHRFTEWRRRVGTRHELLFLSDRTLNDIGLTRCEVRQEMNKPFWMV